MQVKFKPLGNRVLILPKVKPKEVVTESGLIMPVNDKDHQMPNMGTVISQGSESTEVKIGDLVTYGVHAGKELVVEGQTFLLMTERDIDGIFIE